MKTEKLFQLLRPYEKDSTDSMDWAEYGYLEIDEYISNFTTEDWQSLEVAWHKESASVKKLLANHIYIEGINAESGLRILKNMIFEEDEGVVYEAIRQFIWHFITTKAQYQGQKTEYKTYVEFKKIFANEAGKNLIKNYIDKSLLKRIEYINSKNQFGLKHDEIVLFLNSFSQ